MCLFLSVAVLGCWAPLSSRTSGVRVWETSRLFLTEGLVLLLNCYATNPAVSSAWCSLPKWNELSLIPWLTSLSVHHPKVKAQNGSSGRIPDWLDCWAHCRAPWRGGRLSTSVNNAWLLARAAPSVVGPATQALTSNGTVMPTTMIAHPSHLPQGQDNARPPLAIMYTRRAAIVSILFAVFFH